MTNTAPSAAANWHDFLESYRPAARSGYDEMIDSRGHIRPHWRTFVSGLSALSAEERQTRAQRMDRRVRETGIAYDIFADPDRPSQRWQLDLSPIIISAAEWRWLSEALIQRARLFDAMLQDLYGEQNVLRRGLLPPEIVFSDSAYLMPCQGILPNAGPLQFYAADLARGADGLWRVIDSHTETLAGIGFVLANRVVHTHVAGDLFKQVNAVRLSGHFHKLQSALAAHSGRQNARIALLTPGPHHEDYFSHAYLARYLGYLLVEGPDLRTKDGQVYLKTLEGLKQIDLILRCVDGDSSDPLELDPSVFEGPAGLLNVCRQSPRTVVNAVGSALAQNRALGAYLPQLSEHLLGEELALSDAPRLWLGDKAARNRVQESRDGFVVRKAQERTGRPGQAELGRQPHELSDAERELLWREIDLHGASLVAEEKISFSTAPVHIAGGLAPRPFAVRFFVARTETGYEAMPGGLAMSVDPAKAVALSTPDGQTRDVWVLSAKEQAPHTSLWRPTLETARVQRSQRATQSRVADDLFWLGRYSERADWIMRVLRSALRRIEEDSGPIEGRRGARRCLEVLMTRNAITHTASREPPADREIEQLCTKLISSPYIPRTLEQTFDGLYRVAHLTRDRLSHEAWQTLSKFRPGEGLPAMLASAKPVAMLDLLDEGLSAVAAFNGLMHENMTRNFGWAFLDMGRRLERAYNLSEAVLSLFTPPPDADEEASSLLLLLELADSFITYRSRYRLDPMLALVLDLLLLDKTNPRSLAYQLTALAQHLDELPNGTQADQPSGDRRLSQTLLSSIRQADIEAIAQEPGAHMLERLMRQQIELLPDLSNAIARHYFNLTDETLQRVHTRTEPAP
jgi:uncharacterized circularly permuted ATP-grasp superfamily protein/uncharacterized alpha-E superfamily protein